MVSKTELDQISLLQAENYKRYPTEEACITALYSLVGISCNDCNSSNIQRFGERRRAYCLDCKKTTWLLARTFFQWVKKPRAYLLALEILGRGLSLNASLLSKLVPISASSAMHVINKVAMVVEGHIDQTFIQIESEDFAYSVVRRTRDTPAGEHVHSEFDALKQKQHSYTRAHSKISAFAPNTGLNSGNGGQGMTISILPSSMPASAPAGLTIIGVSNSMSSSVNTAAAPGSQGAACHGSNAPPALASHTGLSGPPQLSPNEQLLFGFFGVNPITARELELRSKLAPTAVLTTLTMLELAGMITTTDGIYYTKLKNQIINVCSKNPSQAPGKTIVGLWRTIQNNRFIRDTFRGIGRRKIQNYLILGWIRRDRSTWTVQALIKACLSSRPIRYRDVASYVSPQIVLVYSK